MGTNSQLFQSSYRFALSILFGGAGGFLFYICGFPLPWLLGALCGTLIGSVSGAPVEVSKGLRNYIIVIIGVMLGGTFTPDIIDHVPDWIPTLTASVIYVGVVTLIAQIYCRKVAGMDQVTALFSGLPGGLSEMVILGEEAGANVKKLTLTHACRVVSVLLFIPFLLTYGLKHEAIVESVTTVFWDIKDVVILLICGISGMFFAKILRFPAHRLTGPLVFSSILHLNGVVVSDPPQWAAVMIQLILGSAIGSRFFGTPIKEIGKVAGLALGMTSVMLMVTFASAYLISQLTGVAFDALILALSPGGFAEMALAALSMGIDPAFVTTHHAMRLFVIVFVTPIIIKFVFMRSKS